MLWIGSLPRVAGNKNQKTKKGGSRSVTLDGNPDVECGGVLLSHTLSSAVPSPRPGLSFRVRKGTGRLTWAMTTAKPIQRSDGNHRTGGTGTTPRFRSWRSGNRTTDASKTLHRYRFRDHKKTMLLAIQRKKPPQDETRPNKRVGKCAAFAR